MNRRNFIKSSAAFVAGCALALGVTRKIEPRVMPFEEPLYTARILGPSRTMYWRGDNADMWDAIRSVDLQPGERMETRKDGDNIWFVCAYPREAVLHG